METEANRPAGWKHFDDFADGIATNRLPVTDALAGRALAIELKNTRKISLLFTSSDKVEWREGQDAGSDWYEALQVAPDVFFSGSTHSRSSSL